MNILEYDKLSRVAETLERIEASGSFGGPALPTVPLQVYNDVVNMHNDLVRKLAKANAEIEALTEKRTELRALIAQWKEYAESVERESDYFKKTLEAVRAELHKLRSTSPAK